MNYFSKFSQLLPNYLLALLPLALVSGPFFSNLIICLISIIFLFHIANNKKYFFYINNLFSNFFFIFFLLILFNSIVNFIDIKAFKSSFFYFRFGLFALALAFFLNKSEKLLKLFFFSLLFTYLILIFDGYWQFYNGKNILGYQVFGEKDGLRVSSFFKDELILGSFISRTYPIFLGLFILIFNKKNKVMIIFICALVEILIFMSGERTSIFILVLFTLLTLIFIKKYRKIKIYASLLSFAFVIFLIFIKPALGNRLIYQSLDQMGLNKFAISYYKIFPLKNNEFMKNILKNEEQVIYKNKIKIISSTHQGLYETAYNMFKKNIFLGIGPNNFRYLCDDKRYFDKKIYCSTHPHNYYLQILSELGFSGFVFLFFTFFSTVYFLFKNLIYSFKKKHLFADFEICLIILFFINLFPIMPNGNFFTSWLTTVVYLPVGFFIWSRYCKNPTKKIID